MMMYVLNANLKTMMDIAMTADIRTIRDGLEKITVKSALK